MHLCLIFKFCITRENLLAENMKDYFIHVLRTITDVVTTKGKN